jgi:hypothetical protein
VSPARDSAVLHCSTTGPGVQAGCPIGGMGRWGVAACNGAIPPVVCAIPILHYFTVASFGRPSGSAST